MVTVGTFDGVHWGHRQVLDEIASRARRLELRSLLVTFDPHPLEVVNPDTAPHLLTLGSERREVLAQSDLDYVVFMEFTPELSRLTPRQFVKLLIRRFRMRELVIGYDHGFGRDRAGDAGVLERLGADLGFRVDVVGSVELRGRPVSSTLVRRAVAGGDLATAKEFLGRHYSLNGVVVPGEGRGQQIGYRTINLAPPDERKLLPPDGVYAVKVEWRDGSAGGMMHQGARPTFGDRRRSLEIHLFDTDEELYGRRVKVSWVSRLREVREFESSEALKTQLDQDLVNAQDALTQEFA